MMHKALLCSRSPRSQRGLSIVELMVGVAIGLFVVAGATMLTSTQLSENRKLLLETQIQQDLRAAADIISRDMRRGGFYNTTDQAVWYSDAAASAPVPSPVSGMTPSINAVPGTQTQYRYIRSGGNQGPFGFKLEGGRLKSYFANAAGWHDLTDANTVEVTTFSITPTLVNEPTPPAPAVQQMPCPRLCPDLTTACWPTVLVREFQISIVGRSVSDATVTRAVNLATRVRNDELQANAAGGAVCPS